MRLLLAILALSLLPCYALAGEVKTTLEYTIPYGQTIKIPGFDHPGQTVTVSRAGQLRIVRCTEGQAAVQEYVAESYLSCGQHGPCRWITEGWRDLSTAPGCYPLGAAQLLMEQELDWRNRTSAPYVIVPEQVVE